MKQVNHRGKIELVEHYLYDKETELSALCVARLRRETISIRTQIRATWSLIEETRATCAEISEQINPSSR